MNKKYFFAVIITLSLLGSAACHSITGSAEVREKIVDCDADLPLDELHRCIEEEAEKYAPKIKNSTTFYSKKNVLEDVMKVINEKTEVAKKIINNYVLEIEKLAGKEKEEKGEKGKFKVANAWTNLPHRNTFLLFLLWFCIRISCDRTWLLNWTCGEMTCYSMLMKCHLDKFLEGRVIFIF